MLTGIGSSINKVSEVCDQLFTLSLQLSLGVLKRGILGQNLATSFSYTFVLFKLSPISHKFTPHVHIKMDHVEVDLSRDIGLEGVDWFRLAQDRHRWWVDVNTTTNLQVTQKRKFFECLSPLLASKDSFPWR